VRRWVDVALVAVLVALAGAGATAVISGRYQLRPVLSGSMRPGLPVGGIVVTERVPVSSLQVRDVVVFHSPDQPQELIVHRIISLTPGPSGLVVKTQGDANTIPDPWTVSLRGDTAYRAVYSLPLVGYVAVWAHGPAGRLALMITGLLIILAAAASGLIARRRSTSRSPQRDDGSSPATHVRSPAPAEVDLPEHDELEVP
jgi:signal peptidase I